MLSLSDQYVGFEAGPKSDIFFDNVNKKVCFSRMLVLNEFRSVLSAQMELWELQRKAYAMKNLFHLEPEMVEKLLR
jgi:hypothetical protein